jgi:hypothetical protein
VVSVLRAQGTMVTTKYIQLSEGLGGGAAGHTRTPLSGRTGSKPVKIRPASAALSCHRQSRRVASYARIKHMDTRRSQDRMHLF